MKAIVGEQFDSRGVRAVRGLEGSPSAPPAAKEVEPFTAAMRGWRLILAFAVGGGLAAYLRCRMFTPLYVATASVMIDPREAKRIVVSTDPSSALPPSEETVRKNEIAIIRSRKLAELVVSELELARDPEFNPDLRPRGVLSDALDRAHRAAP